MHVSISSENPLSCRCYVRRTSPERPPLYTHLLLCIGNISSRLIHSMTARILHLSVSFVPGIQPADMVWVYSLFSLSFLPLQAIFKHPHHTVVVPCVTLLSYSVPQRDSVVLIVPPVPQNQVFFLFCVLIWMAVRSVTFVYQAFPIAVIFRPPLINCLTASPMPYTCCCYTISFRISNYPPTKPCF